MTRPEVVALRQTFDDLEARHGRDIAIETIVARARATHELVRAIGQVYEPVLSTVSDELMDAIKAVVVEVARAHGVTAESVWSRSRTGGVSECRQECFWRVRQMGLSLPAVGRVFGRHHATVLAGIEVHEARQAPKRQAA